MQNLWSGSGGRAWGAVVFAISVARVLPVAAHEQHRDWIGVRMADARADASVRRAVAGAYERLAEPECQALLGRFRDASGRTLRENLDAAGETAQDYLARRVFFYEGYHLATCRSRRARKGLAVTEPGSRVIFVCSQRFGDLQERNPAEAEAVILHEMLHSLGLGENPPSSTAITIAVTRNCFGTPPSSGSRQNR